MVLHYMLCFVIVIGQEREINECDQLGLAVQGTTFKDFIEEWVKIIDLESLFCCCLVLYSCVQNNYCRKNHTIVTAILLSV